MNRGDSPWISSHDLDGLAALPRRFASQGQRGRLRLLSLWLLNLWLRQPLAPSRSEVSVIDFWLAIPLLARYLVLAAVGLTFGALANHAIYSWCYFPRPISPWGEPPQDATARRATDRVPLLGWLTLRRESSIHGRAFWIRPLLVELGLMAALPALYAFETQSAGLIPEFLRLHANIQLIEPWMTRVFFTHAVLVLLMTAATFIDFDEQTIPDIITIPGTLLALLGGAVSPYGFMPVINMDGMPVPVTFELPLSPPDAKWFSKTGLLTGLAIYTGWCFALADRRVILRHGLAKAIQYFGAGLVRHSSWKLLVGMWIAGVIGISIVHTMGGLYWYGLFTSLIGLAVGGGIVWAVRIVASSAMGVEAMGFGDVTLMAMIGAVIGWQASVAAFFLSPIAAIAIVLVQYIITREPRVPFGPYLCAGTMITILGWATIYNDYLSLYLSMGQVLLWILIFMFVAMGIGLFIWRKIKMAIFY